MSQDKILGVESGSLMHERRSNSNYPELWEGPIRGLRLPFTAWNRLLAEGITTFEQLKAAAHQLEQINGIGPKMARVIRDEIARAAASNE